MHYCGNNKVDSGQTKTYVLAFWVMGLKILGRVSGTHISIIFFKKKYDFMHFERHFAFQNA